MKDYAKKGYKIAVLALVFALIGWVLPGLSTTTGTNNTTTVINESIFQIEVNNTNLAPTFAGESIGTGERVQNVTYYANATPIQLFTWSHGSGSGQTSEMHLYINGTKVLDTAGRPLGIAEQNNRSLSAIIPKYSSYKVEISNFHHYEWREYKIISGQNGSVNLTTNYYNTTGSSVNNSSLNLKVNKTGDIITGAFNSTSIGGIYNLIDMSTSPMYFRSNSTSSISYLYSEPNKLSMAVISSTMGTFNLTQNLTSVNVDLDLSNNNLLNCGNCSQFSKLIKTTSVIGGAVVTGTTTIPHDDTIPQITEGNFLLNATITPQSINSKIKACAQVIMSTSATSPNLLQVTLFINGSSDAVAISSAYSPAQYYEVNTGVCYITTVPTTNTFNVSVRYGSNAAGTVTVNGANGVRTYGGAYNSYLIVDEYKD